MTAMPAPVVAMADAQWLAHRYDPEYDAVHFVRISRAAHARAAFLIDELLVPDGAPIIFARADAVAAAPIPAPIHYLFHSAFCCSTLLARAFDIPGIAMGLKEPVILNDIVGWRHRGEALGPQVAQVLDESLKLLARPFRTGEATIVKPSNLINGLADVMLALRPEARALLLHAPLPIYLRSIVKKGLEGRLWARDLLTKLLREGLIDLGLEGDDYLRLTDLQAAAVGWLAQHALFGRLAAKYPDRVRTLDSETLLARPYASVVALAALYGLSIDGGQVDAIITGPAFRSHSKHGTAFDGAARDAEYAAAANAHGEEIEKVEVWASAVAASASIPTILPAALLA